MDPFLWNYGPKINCFYNNQLISGSYSQNLTLFDIFFTIIAGDFNDLYRNQNPDK